jgi:drug/metabolite transporter (DMT)-like permease
VRREAVSGLLFGLLGVYLVIERGFVLPHMGGGTHLWGDLLVVLALISEAAYTVFGKAELDRYPGLLVTAGGIIGSLFVWVPVGLADMARNGIPHLDAAAWAGVLYMAIAATVIAYLGWMLALRYVNAAGAAATLFLQPLAGTALAVLVLGERPSWVTLAGGLCIVAGVWIASRGEARAARRALESEALVS